MCQHWKRLIETALAIALIFPVSLAAQRVGKQVLTQVPGEAAKPQPRLQVLSSHNSGVSSLAFSNNGKWLVTGGYDNVAMLWDIASGREIHAFHGHSEPIYTMTISDDSKWLVTGGPDRIVRLWDLAAGKEVRVFKGHTDTVRSISISKDGLWLATAGEDGTARLWEVSNGKEIRIFKDPKLDRAVLSSDGKWLVTACSYAERPIILWDASTGAMVRTFGDPDMVWSLDLSEDGQTLATPGQKNVTLWELGTGKKVRTFKSEGHSSAALSADGKRLAIAAHLAGGVVLWDTQSGKELAVENHHSWVTNMAMSRDGKRIATAALKDFDVQVCADGKHLRWLSRRPTVRTGVATFSANGKWLLTANRHGDPMVMYDRVRGTQFRIWDLTKGAEIRIFESPGFFGSTAILTPDDRCVMVKHNRDGGSAAELWDLNTGKRLREFEHFGLDRLAVSADGKWLATSAWRSLDKKDEEERYSVRLWETDTGKLLRTIEKSGWVASLALSGDKKWLVTGAHDGKATAWDLSSTWKNRTFQAHPFGLHGLTVAVTGDSKYLVTGGTDCNPRLWDLSTGRELRTFYGHENEVGCLTLSSDGKSLVTGSRNGTVRIWDLATAKALKVFSAHFGEVGSVSLTDDGRRLVTTGSGDSSRIWDIASGKELCRTVSFDDGGWAVFDADNRFDSAKVDQEGIYWVLGTESVPLPRFRDEFHDAGLLAKYMGFNVKPLRKIAP